MFAAMGNDVIKYLQWVYQKNKDFSFDLICKVFEKFALHIFKESRFLHRKHYGPFKLCVLLRNAMPFFDATSPLIKIIECV